MSKLVSQTDSISNVLMNARCRLLAKQPFYGSICMNMVWIKDNRIKTMGVCITDGGEVQCRYSEKFVRTLTVPELYGVLQHEVEHLVRLHCLRIGGRNPLMWNYACDMTVNGPRKKPRIGYEDAQSSTPILPMKGKIIFIPPDWDEKSAAEEFYNKLMKEIERLKLCPRCAQPLGGPSGKGDKEKGKGKGNEKNQDGGSGQNENDDQNQDDGDQGCEKKKCCSSCGKEHGICGIPGIDGEMIDDHAVWQNSTVSDDEARQIVKEIVDQAIQNSRGLVPGHLQEAIDALKTPKVRWREMLRNFIGKYVGNRRRTYSRANRRNDDFGVPGVSHHAASKATVIIDTSGSIDHKQLEQFFGEIDFISARCAVTILQWDAGLQGYSRYRHGDWKKFKINGRGGTDMREPLKWMRDNHKVTNLTIMLTDGYTPWLDAHEVQFPVITVLTTSPSQSQAPTYGKVVRMRVDD